MRVPEEAPDAAGIREVAGAFAIAARQPAEAEEATRRHLRSVITALLDQHELDQHELDQHELDQHQEEAR